MPSQGCILCRKRRIKCDEGKPGCNRRSKIGTSCPGYDRGLRLVFYDQKGGSWRKTPQSPIDQASQGSVSDNSVLVDHSAPKPASKSTPKPCAPNAQKHNARKADRHKSRLELLDGQQRSQMSTPVSIESSTSPNAQILQLQPCLTSDIDQRALCLFNSSFIREPLIHGASDSFLEFLPELYASTPASSCLRSTLTAVTHLNFMNQYSAGETLSEHVAKSYGEALRTTNAALRDPATAVLDQTLTSVWLLSMYELLAPGGLPIAIRRRTPWVNHVSGTLTLLRIRGKDQLRTHTGRQLFSVVQSPIVAMSMMMGEMPPQEIATLSDILLETDQQDTKGSALVSNFMQCAARIRCKLRRWIAAGPDFSLSTNDMTDLRNVIEQGLDVESNDDFEDWAAEFLEWRPKQAGLQTTPPCESLQHRKLFFASNNVMLQWVTIWTTRLLLIQSLLKSFNTYKAVSKDYIASGHSDEQSQSSAELLLCDRIKGLEKRLTEAAESTLDTVSFAFGEVDSKGGETARSIYSVYHSSSIGAYHMFWPLGVNLACPYTTLKQKLSAREALRSVGERFHVVQALRYVNF